MSVYLGDLIDGGTHDFTFTTVRDTGLPTVLAGTPVLSVYKDNNLTQTTIGPTLTVDHDGVVGLNHVRLVLTDAFYVADTDYSVVITTGTVNSVSVVGYVVAQFSISNRMPNVNVAEWLDTAPATPTVAGVPEVDITHQGGGAIPAPAVTGVPDVNPTHWADGAIPAQGITGVPEVDVTHFVAGLVPTPATTGIPDVNVQEWLDTIVTAVTAGRPDVNVAAIDNVTNAAAVLSAWLNEGIVGTADAGGSTTTIVDAALTEIDDIHNYKAVLLTSGTDAGSIRLITNFVAASDTLTFTPPVSTAIGAGVTFVLIPLLGNVDVQSWLGVLTGAAAVNALIAGRVDSSVGAMAANVITAAAINAAAITAAKFAAGAIDANAIAAAAIVAATFATDALDAAALATDAVNEIARAINPQTNTALSDITFEMYDSTNHNPATGLTVAGERSIDGGAYAAVSGAIAEISDGTYQFDAANADMNGAMIVFRFTAATADDTFVHVRTAA